MTSRTRRLIFGMPPLGVALVVLIATTALMSGIAIALLMQDRDVARNERDAVAGQSQELVDCVRDPDTTDCAAEAEELDDTIDEVAQGDPGPAGAQGPVGPQGLQGAAGQTGPQGPRGFIGPVGPAGPPGDDGDAGSAGAVGQQGPQGEPGATGPAGEPGPPGPAGDPGQDGRDGTAQPGTYTCPDGQYVAGLTVGDAGAVFLDCRPLPADPAPITP